ncbi:MAG: phosphate acyltransferase [Bacteroidales bacterium]
MIRSLNQMVEMVLSQHRKNRIAVAWAQDPHTIGAIHKAVNYGFAEAILIGQSTEIRAICWKAGIDPELFTIIDCLNEVTASKEAVNMTNTGKADIAMKGLVGTDKFLQAVLDKENGLMVPDAVLTYVCAIEIPSYHKLLFVTDPAVIPFPTLPQKTAMTEYSIEMAGKFGIEKPKIALISATEKRGSHFPSSSHYVKMCKMAAEGRFGDCIMDGPVDLFLACDKKSVEIKGIKTPVDGDADILLFPSLESCNPFYKALMLFAQGELAGIVRGTKKPVVVMSRSESEKSKFYCIALACLMA